MFHERFVGERRRISSEIKNRLTVSSFVFDCSSLRGIRIKKNPISHRSRLIFDQADKLTTFELALYHTNYWFLVYR